MTVFKSTCLPGRLFLPGILRVMPISQCIRLPINLSTNPCSRQASYTAKQQRHSCGFIFNTSHELRAVNSIDQRCLDGVTFDSVEQIYSQLIHQASMANTVKAWAWQCQDCQRECVPIRAESRCMCGHRLKEHTEGHRCSNRSCSCPKFSFIVAEGSWILRCRCKHKHTEHDPTSHACRKAACACSGFNSPWVCNCDHPWCQHQQVLVERQVLRLSDMIAQAHQASGSSSTGQPVLSDVAAAAAAAEVADRNISSTAPAALAAAAGLGAAGGAGDSDGVAVEVGADRGSRQDGRLSCSGARLQQLEQQRRRQQQVPDAIVGHAPEQRGPAAATGDATAKTVTAPGASGQELLLAQGELTCEVNRWDLVQRGAGNR